MHTIGKNITVTKITTQRPAKKHLKGRILLHTERSMNNSHGNKISYDTLYVETIKS